MNNFISPAIANRYAIFLCSWDVADSLVGQLTTSDLVANMWEDVLIHLAAIIKIWWRWWKWINQTNGSSLTVNCIRIVAIASHLLQVFDNTKDLQNWIKVRRKIQCWVQLTGSNLSASPHDCVEGFFWTSLRLLYQLSWYWRWWWWSTPVNTW